MKTKYLVILLAVALLTSSAFAGSFTGTVTRYTGNMLDAGYSGSGLSEGTFTSSALNFFTTGGQNSGQTLGDFFAYGAANTANITAGLTSIMSNCFDGVYETTGACQAGNVATINNPSTSAYSTGMHITGTAYFYAGQTYNITHDDGVILTLTVGAYSETFDWSSPVYVDTNSFTVAGSGNYNVTIDYMGTNGNPEALILQTPEPASLALLRFGLIGLALIRRRPKTFA
jgi:PEP-CTERM motif